mgnify:CR=1 FL=1
MKKMSVVAVMLFFGMGVFAQAVKDRNVIPVGVSLNQVLRMTVTNGGNIEFVFNTIEDYKNGISSETAASGSANPATSNSMYLTDFTVSSSTRWKLTYGTEEATFLGTDNPSTAFALNNVGFKIRNNGLNLFETAPIQGATSTTSLWSAPTRNATVVAALQQYPVVLIEDNNTVNANAGDAADNSFTLEWRCGTAEGGTTIPAPMNQVKIIDQSPSPAPDRYVVNVLFDLAID